MKRLDSTQASSTDASAAALSARLVDKLAGANDEWGIRL